MSLRAPLLLSVALLSSCSVFAPQGPTDVARGEYYAAGKPDFDSFFIQLHELQVELLAAPRETEQARRNLTEALGLTALASDDSLSSRLRAELKKLETQGLRVRLDVPESPAPDASATLYTNDHTAASPLRSKLPEEATRLVRSRNRMRQTREQLEKLRVTGIQLDANVERDFRVEGPWKRDEVRQNLADGQKLITLMLARAQEVQTADEKLLTLLASSGTTDPNLEKTPTDTAPATVEEPVKTARRPRARPAPGAAVKPGAVKPGRAVKPAAPKPRAEDDGAAPKPVQGSAPAEIEP
jgi:hypothetical protein